MTKSELIEYLEFKADLEREMARQLANWSPTEKPTPTTNNMEIKESFDSNGNYSTGTITNIDFHKSGTGTTNNVNTVYVKLDHEDQEKIYNVTYNPRCRVANWLNFYKPLQIPGITKNSSIQRQEMANLNSLIGKRVKVVLTDGKIDKFVEDNELDWNSEIGE